MWFINSSFNGGQLCKKCGNLFPSPDQNRKLLDACPSLLLFNPRCSQGAPADSRKQIVWEHEHLHKASAVMFWFPSATLCPITLYELGAWSILCQQTGTKLFVGCDENYQRKFDVQVQTQLANPDIVVHESLQGLIDDIIAWFNSTKNDFSLMFEYI